MEWNDIYDQNRNPTGRTHRRGTPMAPGDFVVVACAWISNGRGQLLITRRAPQKKSSPNQWENSGGAVRAGETSLEGISREVFEETGIRAKPEEFAFMGAFRSKDTFYDLYFLQKDVPLEQLRLQPGETVEAKWVTPEELREMIDRGQVAAPIAKRFRAQEKEILARMALPEK